MTRFVSWQQAMDFATAVAEASGWTDGEEDDE